MWIMTSRGFYSAVQKAADKDTPFLTVRARSKQDLLNLADLLPEGVEPVKAKGTDYPWRIRIDVADWTKICATLALEIDYANFKDEVKAKQGERRASVYSRIWGALLAIEREPDAKVAKVAKPMPAGLWPEDYPELDAPRTRSRRRARS